MSDPNATESTAISSPPPMGDFQRFPAEIRDMIFQHLLDARYTRLERRTCDDPAYKFHTNILAVNREIHDEAQDYLYKNNTFVVASADWFDADGDSFFTINSYIPIVTESKAARMKHHSLRIHITGNAKVPTQACLLLLQDLDALIVTLRVHVSQRLVFALMMEDDATSSRYTVVGTNQQVNTPCRFKVQFLDTPWRTQDVNTMTQRNTLNSLSEFNCASMGVTFEGVLPEHLAFSRRVRDTMGATLISMLALDWLQLDTFQKKKKLADKAMRAGELMLAEIAYMMVDAEIGLHIEIHKGSPRRTQWSTDLPLKFLRTDVILTVYYLQLKLGRCSVIETVIERLKDILGELEHGKTVEDDPGILDVTENLEGAFRHLILLTELYWDDSRSVGPKLDVGRLIREFSVGEHLPYSSHDLAILRKVSDRKAPARLHLPKENCNVSMLEPQCFNFHQMPAVPRKPDFLVGMQNLQVLQTLDDATRRSIDAVQRGLGQKATVWA
jgi:hypothetical protein